MYNWNDMKTRIIHTEKGDLWYCNPDSGEITQKLSNYRKRLVGLGRFEQIGGKSLNAFIFESNRTGRKQSSC
jgi:hypothetical protein